jgi:hypothetical protein
MLGADDPLNTVFGATTVLACKYDAKLPVSAKRYLKSRNIGGLVLPHGASRRPDERTDCEFVYLIPLRLRS